MRKMKPYEQLPLLGISVREQDSYSNYLPMPSIQFHLCVPVFALKREGYMASTDAIGYGWWAFKLIFVFERFRVAGFGFRAMAGWVPLRIERTLDPHYVQDHPHVHRYP